MNAALISASASTNGGTNSAIIGAGNSIVPGGTRFAFIGAGNFNNMAAGSHSAGMLAGFSNAISTGGVRGLVAGGAFNTNAGRSAVILGGEFNVIGVNSTGAAVVAGNGNLVGSNSTFSAIGGGLVNRITNNSDLATIGGGGGNLISATNKLDGTYVVEAGATIAGGIGNEAGGNSATVGGGRGNTAAGDLSTIAGGGANRATGSFATVPGGNNVDASNNRSFVWGDGPEITGSFGDNTFTVRCTGGARFYTGAGTNIGVRLTNGATSWASLSDSNAKTKVEAINPRRILDKLASLAVTEWEYKDAPNRRYIGPMAQDFHAAFGLGDDTTISTLDSDGVMYAAIQGLLEELKERDQKIGDLEAWSRERGAQSERKLQQVEAELRALREQVRSALPPAP